MTRPRNKTIIKGIAILAFVIVLLSVRQTDDLLLFLSLAALFIATKAFLLADKLNGRINKLQIVLRTKGLLSDKEMSGFELPDDIKEELEEANDWDWR